MERINQVDYTKVGLSPKNPFSLTFNDGKRNRSLSIIGPEGFGEETSLESQNFLRTVMLAHLVARHLPKKIETNFEIGDKRFLDKLYEHYNLLPPTIIKSPDQQNPQEVERTYKYVDPADVANSHSGGLDSTFRLLQKTAEGKELVAIHLRNLNPKVAKKEVEASRKQATRLGAQFREVKLTNGGDNTGYTTMRTRDMFLALVVAIASQPYKVKEVLVEGDMSKTPDSHFSEYLPAWKFFNQLLTENGISSPVKWIDPGDIETVGAILDLEKNLNVEVLPLVDNCFSAPFQRTTIRAKWERETPTLAELSPEHWCGSCLKCRRVTLGRISYSDPKLARLPDQEVKFFVEDTYGWMKRYPHNQDLTSKSFLKHLKSLLLDLK